MESTLNWEKNRMSLKTLLSKENTFTCEDEPKHVYTWYSYGGNPYDEIHVRRKFLLASFPYHEFSLGRKIGTAKTSYREKFYGENSYCENS